MPTQLTTTTPTLLFVDDEPEYREEFAYSLNGQNYRLLVESSADRALALLKEKHEAISVIITDYNMPGMSGLELLKAAHEQWPHISRIMCTNISDVDVAKAAINTGQVLAYFNKPWTDEELIATLQRAVDTHQEMLFNKTIKSMYATLEDNEYFKDELFNIIQLETSDLAAAAIGCIDCIELDANKEAQDQYLRLCKFNNKLIYQLMKNMSSYLSLRKKMLPIQITATKPSDIQASITEALAGYLELDASIDWDIQTPAETRAAVDPEQLAEIIINMATHFMRNEKNHMKISLRPSAADPKKLSLNILAQTKVPADQQTTEYTKGLLAEENTASKNTMDHAQLYGSYFGLYIAKLIANEMNISISYEENKMLLFKLSIDLFVNHPARLKPDTPPQEGN